MKKDFVQKYKRIIGILNFNEGVLTRTRNFTPDYIYTDSFIDYTSFDEMVVLDVTKSISKSDRRLFLNKTSEIASECNIPMTIGGNINSIIDVHDLFNIGADRVLVNYQKLLNLDLTKEISDIYGSQSLIASVDHTDSSSLTSDELSNLKISIKFLDSLGVGEYLLNSKTLDGTLKGPDLNFASIISKCTKTPIVICGGIGNWNHMSEAFSLEFLAGVGTSNILHLTSNSIHSAKIFLSQQGLKIRLPWNP